MTIHEFLEGSVIRFPLYHGSNRAGLTTLYPDHAGEYGIYLSPRRGYAQLYGRYTYEVFVHAERPLVTTWKGVVSPGDLTRADVERLQALGWDSIVVTNSTAEAASEVVLFTSDQAWIWAQRDY